MKTLQIKRLTALITAFVLCITIAYAQRINHLPGIKLHRSFFPQTGRSYSSGNVSGIRPHHNNAPCIKDQLILGGEGDDLPGNILKVPDGIIVCGNSNSHKGFHISPSRGIDAFVEKLNNNGQLMWVKVFGGTGDDRLEDIIQTDDGGYFAAGWTSSNDGDVSGNHGGPEDVWAVKLDRNGNLVWQQCYGGTGDDYAVLVAPIPGGYGFDAFTNSTDGQVTNNHGDYDQWIVKLNRKGSITWQSCFGGSGYDHASGFMPYPDGSMIIGMWTYSIDGNIDKNFGWIDGWIAGLDANDSILWHRTIGSSGDDYQNSFLKTSDGNIVIPFGSNGANGDITCNHGRYDMNVMKISKVNGHTIWEHCYGDANDNAAIRCFETANGDIVTTGGTGSNAEDPSTADVAVLETDANGNEKWLTRFGGSLEDDSFGGFQMNNGNLMILCYTLSDDGDFQGAHGGWDLRLVQLSTDCEKMAKDKIDFTVAPNPISNAATISFSLRQSQKISINIFDLNGRLIKTIANSQMQPGTHQLTWNATNENGNAVATGVYYLKLNAGSSYVETKKISLIK
jgi:FlgD Ig-like domain